MARPCRRSDAPRPSVKRSSVGRSRSTTPAIIDPDAIVRFLRDHGSSDRRGIARGLGARRVRLDEDAHAPFLRHADPGLHQARGNHLLVAHGLEALGIVRSGRVHWNLSPAVLYEEAVRRGEASMAAEGPLVARTGQHTGRSPNDKFVVKEPSSEQHVHWGAVNRPVDEAKFDALHKDMMAYLQDKELFVLDAWAGADGKYRLPIRVVTQFAWHNLFARNMFIPETDPARQAAHRPEYTVIDCPGIKADPARHGSRTETAIFVHFGRKLVLIAGTQYAGEIKKSIFTILNTMDHSIQCPHIL